MLSKDPVERNSQMHYQRSYQVSATELGAGSNAPDMAARCLNELQQEFAQAILDPDLPVPRGVVGPDGAPSTKRFAVYRNNVVTGLVEALKAAFPAVARLVGDEFFAAMARIYVVHAPPESPIMLDYGATFPDFVGAFEPAKAVPYLGDVARLERAWAEAYHSAEALPIKPDQTDMPDVDFLPTIRILLHPSLRIVRSPFPVVTIWQMNIAGGEPSPLDIGGGGEDALVVRPVAEVEVRKLSAGAAIFIQETINGAAVVDAIAAALCGDPDFDLACVLGSLLEAGGIVGWNLHEDADLAARMKST